MRNVAVSPPAPRNLDFTSALYLGIDHDWASLRRWPKLTLGKPSALESPPGAAELEAKLASLTGCEAALLAPSTLHLFVDLLPLLARPNAAIFVDRNAYRTAWWGVAQAAARGVPHRRFGPNGSEQLERLLARHRQLKPIIITDGFCVSTGRSVPLREYASLAAGYDGLLVVDDTQALGIFGSRPGATRPYGAGGGGSLKRWGICSDNVIVVNSLAKAFGAPVAMLGGSAGLVEAFRRRSATRVHCSPPSVAAITAARRAVEINSKRGDALRCRLAKLVVRLNRGLARLGIETNGSVFPLRPVKLPANRDAAALHSELAARGIKALLKEGPGGEPSLAFSLNAGMRPTEIDAAIKATAEALQIPAAQANVL